MQPGFSGSGGPGIGKAKPFVFYIHFLRNVLYIGFDGEMSVTQPSSTQKKKKKIV